jgi:Rrf2 family transcriptional regulator, nitric oxide-sensitive transcriptional repressor
MKLTVFTDYALRVLLMLAAPRDSLLTIAEVSQYFRISEAHLMKVTHVLGRSGWVETVRGRNGGMRLTIDPDALKLDQVIAHLEGKFELVECFSDSNTCRLTGACGLETALAQASAAFNHVLRQHSLGSLSRATKLSEPGGGAAAAPSFSRTLKLLNK